METQQIPHLQHLLAQCKTRDDVKKLLQTLAEVCIVSNLTVHMPDGSTISAYDCDVKP